MHVRDTQRARHAALIANAFHWIMYTYTSGGIYVYMYIYIAFTYLHSWLLSKTLFYHDKTTLQCLPSSPIQSPPSQSFQQSFEISSRSKFSSCFLTLVTYGTKGTTCTTVYVWYLYFKGIEEIVGGDVAFSGSRQTDSGQLRVTIACTGPLQPSGAASTACVRNACGTCACFLQARQLYLHISAYFGDTVALFTFNNNDGKVERLMSEHETVWKHTNRKEGRATNNYVWI